MENVNAMSPDEYENYLKCQNDEVIALLKGINYQLENVIQKLSMSPCGMQGINCAKNYIYGGCGGGKFYSYGGSGRSIEQNIY